jgi:hypothetical protein
VRPGEFFFYYDPLDALDPLIVQRWSDPAERAAMRQAALEAAIQA